MDVVIPTLLRDSLLQTLKSVQDTIPDATVILVTGKGVIGDLRNKGLTRCSSEFTCFVDDDIILNKDWFDKCMNALKDKSLIAVSGRTREGYTLGCTVCRTKAFQNAGGFPSLDNYLPEKLGVKYRVVEDAVCQHNVGRAVGHVLHFLVHGFQTESRAGFYNNPVESLRLMFHYFKRGLPEYAVVQVFWLVKLLFVWPFILEDKGVF